VTHATESRNTCSSLDRLVRGHQGGRLVSRCRRLSAEPSPDANFVPPISGGTKLASGEQMIVHDSPARPYDSVGPSTRAIYSTE
jgi:hypothetical protein